MKDRKTTFDERLEIIEQLIRHDVDYKWAAEHYNVSYIQVYGWYRKYTESGNNPESLRDRRGKDKPESKFTVRLEGIFIWEENRNILLILS